MRTITTHHDGHGLAEQIIIEADDLDPNGGDASHNYTVFHQVAPGERRDLVAHIQFQQGPRLDPGSKPGIIDAVLLAIVEDRMNCFNAGKFSDRLNAIVATNVQTARLYLKERADQRARRGVLGKNIK